MNTFSYCGINSETFGCYYVPNASTRFDDRADYDVYDDEADWHDGGVYYGNRLKKRQFELNCYYEQIDRKQLEQMKSWLDRKTYGKLIFEDWPWKYYLVRPTKKLTGEQWTYRLNGQTKDVYSGTFTITFTAYDPLAYLKVASLDEYSQYLFMNVNDTYDLSLNVIDSLGSGYAPQMLLDDDSILFVMASADDSYEINDQNELLMNVDTAAPELQIKDYLNIIAQDDMPEAPDLNTRTFYLYNCGTEVGQPIIRIGGTTSQQGITITNDTNGSSCKLLALPESPAYLEIDCVHGKVYLVNGGSKTIQYEYHDLGFISLEPCGLMDNNLTVHYSAGSNVVTIENRDYEQSLIGKCMRLNGKWYRVLNVSDAGVFLSNSLDASGSETVNIVTMNRMQISGGDINLTKFEIEFQPRVQ